MAAAYCRHVATSRDPAVAAKVRTAHVRALLGALQRQRQRAKPLACHLGSSALNIQLMPNRSTSMPNRAPQNVFSSGIRM